MLVKLHVYQKSDGMFLYVDIGNPNYVIADLGEDKDFTLAPLPDNTKQYRWVDTKWVEVPKTMPPVIDKTIQEDTQDNEV